MKNISTKELNYLRDTLSWELLSAKKCFQYGCQQNNTPYAQNFFDAARLHQQNYTNVLNYVNQMNTQGGQMH